jgi:BirA family biotin operon repressor/biotin-[acetyl-CoA-carboxylase] ligase
VDAAAAILRHLRVWYDRVVTGQAAELRVAWRKRSVPWWGRLVEARAGERVIRGIARDIDDDGALLLSLEGGGLQRVLSGEVTRLRLL